jgi:biotin carboxyl carrier protein
VVNHVKVQAGDAVSAGDVLLVIDSMKMLHEISAPGGGIVSEIRVEAGSQVNAGEVLVVIEEASAAAAN